MKDDKLVVIGAECEEVECLEQLDVSSQWAFKRFGIYEDDLEQKK